MATSRTYARCRNCGAHREDGASLSKRGYCSVCGPAIFTAHNDSLHYHQGEHFKRWRRAMAASVGGVLVDDVLDAE
jgi:predicted  nucleic acid-binding Zn-ribbon protein